jgi:hypothetical protein
MDSTMRIKVQLIGLAAAVLAAWMLGSCSESPTDVLIPNQRPVVNISAGPIRDSVDVFIVTINWNSSDTDGQVERFLYAIDDLDSWFETTTYELTLLVSATDLAGVDSIRVPGTEAFFERYRFRDAHTFYLIAVDDDGAHSDTTSISFTGETFAPETQIMIPVPSGLISLGPSFTVSWEGTDIDGTEAPVGYSYRIVPVDNVLSMTAAEIESTLYDPNSPGDPWSAFEPRTSVMLRDLEIPRDYVFGVRALDQAGAIEPRLRISDLPGPTNVLRIAASESGGLPTFFVSSSVKTVRYPTADERAMTFQIPANSNITFTWEASAQEYGGSIAGYSFGLDLLDPEAENPEDPGWEPESATLTRVVLRFDLPEGANTEEHILYVRARDNVGTKIIATLFLIVVPLTGERDVLLVDDWGPDHVGRAPADCIPPPPPERIATTDTPQDQCHDQYLRESLELALERVGHPEWVVDLYDPLDEDGFVNNREVGIDSTSTNYWVYTGPVTLANLARYKLVVWNVKSQEACQLKTMNREGENNFLAVFIESGGEVWITGTGGFSNTREETAGLSPFGFHADDFAYLFIKLQSEFTGLECTAGCFRASGQNTVLQRQHGFEAGYASPMALAEGFPETLRVVRPPYNDLAKGVPSCEGMVVPTGLDINPRLRLMMGQLDTLYFYLSNGQLQLFPPYQSYMDHAAAALRYSGPGQGRVMCWGFPLYYFPQDRLVTAMSKSIEWFLEP